MKVYQLVYVVIVGCHEQPEVTEMGIFSSRDGAQSLIPSSINEWEYYYVVEYTVDEELSE